MRRMQVGRWKQLVCGVQRCDDQAEGVSASAAASVWWVA